MDPIAAFNNWHYVRHNQRRQEHLASLGLDLTNKTVLELGAGVGDHTSFFLDRGCTVTITEAREGNLAVIASRYPQADTRYLDMDDPDPALGGTFEIVYCYGLLYHLSRPAEALRFMAERCSDLLLLETCVSYHDAGTINPRSENDLDPTQAFHGLGCEPNRTWLFGQLQALFAYVYMPATQPWHEEFPIDWTADRPPPSMNNLTRSVYICSRTALAQPVLLEYVPAKQKRH